MSTFRQLTPEEAAVLTRLTEHDTLDGMTDDEVQKVMGVTPVLEAIDNLADFGHIGPAIDERGRPRARRWRILSAGRDQLERQVGRVASELQAKLPSYQVPAEKARMEALLEIIMPKVGAPVVEGMRPGKPPVKVVPAPGAEVTKPPAGSKTPPKRRTAS